jgi:hypothetical protein
VRQKPPALPCPASALPRSGRSSAQCPAEQKAYATNTNLDEFYDWTVGSQNVCAGPTRRIPAASAVMPETRRPFHVPPPASEHQ